MGLFPTRLCPDGNMSGLECAQSGLCPAENVSGGEHDRMGMCPAGSEFRRKWLRMGVSRRECVRRGKCPDGNETRQACVPMRMCPDGNMSRWGKCPDGTGAYLRSGLAGGGDGVDLDYSRLPDARLEVVRNVFLLNVHAVPNAACVTQPDN
jgi:hypothetical protein